jgi:hypothetical protein
MAIINHFGVEAGGGEQHRPEWSMDEVQLAIAEQAKTYARKLGADAPRFEVKREPDCLDVTIEGSSILIVIEDDMTPGEFVLLKPYAFNEPPLGGGYPDEQFFGEVREIMKEALRGELMPGVDLDEEEPPSDDDKPGDDSRPYGLN